MVALTYLTLFDFGLSRAATRRLSEELARGNWSGAPDVSWSALSVQVPLAVAAATLLAALTPYLVQEVLHPQSELASETQLLLFWVGASVVPLLVASLVRGLLEATRRFDVINIVRVPSLTLIVAVPALATLWSSNLVAVGELLFVAQLVTAACYVFMGIRVLPVLGGVPRFVAREARSLLVFGGWATVVSIVSLSVLSFDRIILAYLVPITTLSYYTAPFDAVMRLQLVPATVAATLFPVFSSAASGLHASQLHTTYAASLRFTAIVMGAICSLLLLFSQPILQFWLGSDFVTHSLFVFQALTIAIFINSLAWLPSAFVMASNRPQVVAKLFAIDLLLFVPVLLAMVYLAGIDGAAVAVVVRSCVELVLFFMLPSRNNALLRSVHSFQNLGPIVLFGVGIIAIAPLLNVTGTVSGAGYIAGLPATALLLATGYFGWRCVLATDDRRHVSGLLSEAVHSLSTALRFR
jgi:O-antigen/teichoic acid export membrane protein